MSKQLFKSWLSGFRKSHQGDRRDENRSNRKDSIYEETRRKSNSIHSSTNNSSYHNQNYPNNNNNNNNRRASASSRRILKRKESTVKLRQIPSGGRRVFVNLPVPKFELSKKGHPPKFATNRIRTSKYTLLSFVPKNLFEQFRRPANIYFLAMAIIQMLPIFEVKSPALTLLPICTVVFITAVKDAFEDFQRHKVDEQYNKNITHTLGGYHNTNYPESSDNKGFFSCFRRQRKSNTSVSIENHFPQTGSLQEKHQIDNEKHVGDQRIETENKSDDVFRKSLSKDVRVGDIILLRNGDSLPADAVLLSSSDKEGVCFVETKDLDGETNLKPRNSIQELNYIQSGADCLNNCRFYIEATEPDPNLYKFEGTLVIVEKSNENGDKLSEKTKIPVVIDNMLLRGHVVRNTKWAIAVVVFTGTDTKIMLNSGETPSKRSRVDKQMNQEIFVAFAVLFILCLICAIMAGVMTHRAIQNGSARLFMARDDSPGYAGFLNFFSSLIIFQNIIPISLYVSIEFVKTFQAFFIWSDRDMWDENAQKSCAPKSWTLSDDLGQIEYIFSDKTGTLTRNIMEFRECSIGGKKYGNNGFSPESEGARGARLRKEKNQNPGHGDEENQRGVVESSSHRQSFAGLINTDRDPLENDDQETADEEFKSKKESIFKEYKEALKNIFDPSYSSLNPDRLTFADPQLFKDIKTSEVEKSDDQSNIIKEYFMLLALCHTVVIEKIDKNGKTIEEEDESDEEENDKVQPKIAEGSQRKNNDGTVVEEKENASRDDRGSLTDISKDKKKRSRLSKFKKSVSGSKLMSVPGLRNLKSANSSDTKKSKRRKRGKEFDDITAEKDTKDRVDDTIKKQLEYKAESPDEAALVNAAKNSGFTFIRRKGKTMTVDILGKEYDFELLNVLEFNSDRKRMSVIIRRPDPWNDIVIYCKGADNVIQERLEKSEKDSEIYRKTSEHTNEFSECGLRTLLTSYRIIDEQEYEKWSKEMDEANTTSEGRAEKIAEAQEKIETDLKLLGATGIEDKLQEGVPQCIESLRKADIKIWVLTGDKLQTAINIGYASNLLDPEMKLWIIRGGDSTDEIMEHLKETDEQLIDITTDNENQESKQENALVIEGSALLHIFESQEAKELFLDLSIRCKSVVCCRVSPLQKALVVELVRKSKKVVTLAIGDGANDVSMIQVANIGVGISGQEGVQASMAADYAICQFRFLHKLLLVHGHWSYSRISKMILSFFFKNIFWVIPALWYQIYSGWSGNMFYDYSFLQLYNIIFTVAPVIILGSTDQDLTAPYLQRLPKVYTIRGKIYTKLKFWTYFLDAVWQSLVVFYAFYFLHATSIVNSNGYSDSMLQFSTSVAITALVLANLLPGFKTCYWTWWQFVAIGFEIVIAFLWVVIYGSFKSTSMFGAAKMVFGQGSFWLTFLLAIILSFLPRYIITFVSEWWHPTIVDKGRRLECYDKKLKKEARKTIK